TLCQQLGVSRLGLSGLLVAEPRFKLNQLGHSRIQRLAVSGTIDHQRDGSDVLLGIERVLGLAHRLIGMLLGLYVGTVGLLRGAHPLADSCSGGVLGHAAFGLVGGAAVLLQPIPSLLVLGPSVQLLAGEVELLG